MADKDNHDVPKPSNEEQQTNENNEVVAKSSNDEEQWSKPIEFLLSCISMSVGLGNIWRFPTTAFENGGGAFLIPYLIILTFIGRPIYFMELVLGQFPSMGPVKVWKVVPALKGLGWTQVIATLTLCSYYCYLMGLSLYFFVVSCQTNLPWATCDPSFANMDYCINSSDSNDPSNSPNITQVTSAEFYFYNEVLKQPASIDDGIGGLDWKLAVSLLVAWVFVFVSLSVGVKSSGKVAYFTAFFPYVVLFTFLGRGASLPGAGEGMEYFLIPEWSKLLDIQVWYNAITQAFFSLGVSYGSLAMFSSHNPFRHNIYRDTWIISLADTLTSIISGLTTFSIIGFLKHETGAENIEDVVQSGPGLIYVSYPTAIAKFGWAPQLFAVLFFLMLFTLGLGSATAEVNMIVKVLQDQFGRIPRIVITILVCIVGCTVGLMYATPGGLILLDLVDFFGGNVIIFIIAIVETIGIMYIYGLFKFCNDIKFMLNISLGIYWKFCWGFFIPVGLVGILAYAFSDFKYPTYFSGVVNPQELEYPSAAIAGGWVLFGVSAITFPICFCHAVYISEEKGLWKKICSTFRPKPSWGPKKEQDRADWEFHCKHIPPSNIKKTFRNLCQVNSCCSSCKKK